MLRLPPNPVPAVAIALLLAASGCSGSREDYPSLAARPIEKALDDAPAPAAPVAAPIDAALERQVAAQRATIDSAAESFARAESETRGAVARAEGQPVQSESWIAAQQSLSTLDATRASTAAALSALDELRLDAAQRAEPADTTSLDALFARAEQIDAAQRATVAELNGALPLP